MHIRQARVQLFDNLTGGAMFNFKATFFTFFCGSCVEMENKEDATKIERVFEAQSLECAKKIAEAMIGEGVYYLEHIHRVADVLETQEKADTCFSWSADLSARIWWETFRKLQEKGECVKIKLDLNENPVTIIFAL